jgi:adenylate cyclase
MAGRDLLRAMVATIIVVAVSDTAVHRGSLALLAQLSEHRVPSRSEVALVLVDDEAARHPEFARAARVYWSTPLAAVTDALLDAGARIIGVDMVFTRDDPASNDWLRTLMRAARDGRVVLGVADGADPALPSAAQRVAVGGVPSLASVNLTPDSDGLVRVMPASHGALPTIAARLAERAGASPTGQRVLASPRPPDFVTWSAAAVLERAGSAELVEAFAGRVVLIGAWLPDDDRHLSIVGDRPGVWLHAVATDSWVRGASLQIPGDWLRWCTVLLGSMLGVWTLGRGQWVIGFLAIAISSVATIVAWHAWVLLPGLHATTGLLCGGCVVAAERLVIDSLRAAAALPRRFRTGDTAATTPVTACFIDIASFTRTSERSPPELLAAELSACLARLSRIIELHHGFVDKYLGDGLMALFGVDGDGDGCKDAFEAACRCLQAPLTLAGQPVLLRIGLACGPARLGMLGDTRRPHFTAIGDVVNVAARLEQLNRMLDTQLLADHRVAAANPHGNWRDLGERKLRGREGPVHVWTPRIPEGRCTTHATSSSHCCSQQVPPSPNQMG